MRIALGIEYDGSRYCGFQSQPGHDTIQARLEQALSQIAAEPVTVQCAGRTDTGVHATGQVIHFDVSHERSDRSWVLGTNTLLPPDIAVTWSRHTGEDFHARFSARARRYRYILQNTLNRPGIFGSGVALYHGDFDTERMQQAALLLKGEHDFSSFRAADDQSRSPWRCVHFIQITRSGPFIIFDIGANAFLNHMVRNIVGSLLPVGSGDKSIEWFREIFEARDRRAAGPTARPGGLYLVSVTYPAAFGLPQREFAGPLWLP